MALLGNAAMLLWYDIVPEQVAEHDDWHTRQHFPERVAIPGFMRAQRWVSASPGPRYFIAYEVADIEVLSSVAYLERLNNPTSWTRQIMPSFRGMVRGFCRFESSHGTVLGTAAVVVRYSAASGLEERLRHWLTNELAADLLQRRGVASVHGLRSDRMPEMTAEQRIRGRDASVDRVLVMTGYSAAMIEELAATALSAGSLEAYGASPGAVVGIYNLACMATASTQKS